MESSDFTIPSRAGYEPAHAVFSGPGYQFVARVTADNAEAAVAFGQMLWDALNPTVEHHSATTRTSGDTTRTDDGAERASAARTEVLRDDLWRPGATGCRKWPLASGARR